MVSASRRDLRKPIELRFGDVYNENSENPVFFGILKKHVAGPLITENNELEAKTGMV